MRPGSVERSKESRCNRPRKSRLGVSKPRMFTEVLMDVPEKLLLGRVIHCQIGKLC